MYEVIDENTIRRVEDGAFIPVNPENADYNAYLAWVDETAGQAEEDA